MKFTFESNMYKGECYRCPMAQDCSVATIVDSSECPLMEANETVWHPFPDQEPKKPGAYLVTVEYFTPPDYKVLKEVDVYRWNGTDWDLSRNEGITAWAHLPRGYEGVSDDT